MASIQVRGQGTVTAEPDEVMIALEVSSVADTSAAAFAEATQRAALLELVLDEIGIERSSRSTTSIVVHDFQEYDAAGAPTQRHRAASSLTLRLPDAELVPALLRSAVERASARVNGPWWRLANRSEASSEACRLAMADAKRRAEAYAGALGLRVGKVEAIEDEVTQRAVRAPASFGPLVDDESMPIHPADLVVSAAVDVTFALENA